MLLINVSNGSEVLKMWTKNNNELMLETLKSFVPDAKNLIDSTYDEKPVLLSISNGKIFNPAKWNPNIVYLVYSGSSSTEPIKQKKIICEKVKIDEQKEPSAKDLDWFQSLKKYALYYEDENKTKHCITPFNKILAATYAHGSHEYLTREYTEKNPIIVQCFYNDKYRVEAKVVKKDNGLDIVILKAVSKNFFDENPPCVVPEIGMRYLMLGLSNIENQKNSFVLGCGHVTAMLSIKARFVGSSGSSYGDSGAGVWNSSGNLIGMNIAVKHNAVQVKKSSDNRQKQYTHAIGGACVINSIGTIEAFATEYIPYEPVSFEE